MIEVIGQPDPIGRVVDEGTSYITFQDRGLEAVETLGDLGVTDQSEEHYTDSRGLYVPAQAEISHWLKSHELRIQRPDGSEEALLAYDEILPFVEQVDAEYAATVTPRLVKNTGNPDHRVPKLDPDMVYPAYVALRTGEAAVLPTSVGNVVAGASSRGLRAMYSLKDRPLAKAGVVLTTMDQIPDLAEIPEGWEDYLPHMHQQGILTGSKLQRQHDHSLFQGQSDFLREHSMFKDGTSMFVTLPGPYSDVVARILASEGILLSASSANKSGEGNNRDIAKLHADIRRGAGYVAWDPEAVTAYPLDEEHESQGVMVDFRPGEDGGRFHFIRYGFMNGPFLTESVAWLRAHPEVGVEQITGDMHNLSDATNK